MDESAIFSLIGGGILFLMTFSLGYATSYIFHVKGLSSFDFASKLIAFIALILIFVLSGWKGWFGCFNDGLSDLKHRRDDSQISPSRCLGCLAKKKTRRTELNEA